MGDSDPSTRRAALDMVLHGKAIVLDAVADEREFACASYDPEVRGAVDTHAAICGDISALPLRGPRTDGGAGPPGAGGEGPRDGGARYAGFTLDREGRSTLTDLGDAARIDSLVAEAALADVTGRLYAMVFAPLRARSGRATSIRVSPDGALSLLPLEILAGGRCSGDVFDPLPRSREEGLAVVRLLRERGGLRVVAHDGAEATRGALESESRPAVLHLATHGYFCPPRGDGRPRSGTKARLDNPLLRSGLVLAPGAGPADGGIVTALEVSGLDLTGTRLMVLSACDTGLGDVRVGAGVFGLRRAFRIAGAESVLMSLWAVPDQETSVLIDRCCEGCIAGAPRAEALRRAALSVLQARRREKGAAHPLFWGGFVLADG